MNKLGTLLQEAEFNDPIGLFNSPHNELNNEDWGETKDIEIITLKQHLREKAFNMVWRVTDDLDKAEHVMEMLLKEKYTHSREFVDIGSDKIIVGVNANKINTGAIKQAFDLLSRISDLSEEKIHIFGGLIEVNET